MNAIILAAGKSSRMYATGAHIHKALLPIMGIPNIERTIMMLHDANINEIIVAVAATNHDFDYLSDKYACTIIYIPSQGKNTLFAMAYLSDYLQDTFIIEADVVCAKNIFLPLKSNTYYVMKYPFPEADEWHPVLNTKGEITSFIIGKESSPAIFGVSYWTSITSKTLKEYIVSLCTPENINDPNIFWDDFIQEIVAQIKIKTIEILPEYACEMNTYNEYITAQNICQKFYANCQYYFEQICIEHFINGSFAHIYFSLDINGALIWQEKLLKHYQPCSNVNLRHSGCIVFEDNELPFVIKDYNSKEYGYFSVAEENEFILLRRLIIDEKYRRIGLGRKVVQFALTYARLKTKELRVNVYDQNAEIFYKTLGFKKNYTNYHIE